MPPTNKALNRLEDIRVIEVSLVDKAANKRTVLLTKRDGEVVGEAEIAKALEPFKVPAGELAKVLEFLSALTKAQTAVVVAPAVPAAPPAELVAKMADVEAKLATALADLTTAQAKLVETEKRTTDVAAELAKSATIIADKDATIATMRETLNKQGDIITKARLDSIHFNAADASETPVRKANEVKVKWSGDLTKEDAPATR